MPKSNNYIPGIPMSDRSKQNNNLPKRLHNTKVDDMERFTPIAKL